MDMLLAGLGMLGCLAIMAVLMPLGMRVVSRLRRSSAKRTPDNTASALQQPPSATSAQETHRERG